MNTNRIQFVNIKVMIKAVARVISSGLIGLSLLGCSTISSPQSPVIRAVAEKPFPFPIVSVSGSSEQLGQQEGSKLSSQIQLLRDKYLLPYFKSETNRFIATSAARMFASHTLPAHKAEITAMASATHIEPIEAMLAQCFLDLSDMTACSTITLPADAASDHVARFGRNLDFLSLGVADKYVTVFIVRPNDGRFAFASIGWPGMIGVLSGMNEHGLCLANMEVKRDKGIPVAMPYSLLYRSVLEQCKTVDEAIALLQRTPIQTANNLMLMDAGGARAVAELNPAFVHIRRGENNAALISTNHQRDQDQDTPGKCTRYDFLHDHSKMIYGQIDKREIEKMLAHVGNHTTLQSMIFEPATRVMYLSAGDNASKGEFHRLELKPLFLKGGVGRK